MNLLKAPLRYLLTLLLVIGLLLLMTTIVTSVKSIVGIQSNQTPALKMGMPIKIKMRLPQRVRIRSEIKALPRS